LTGNISRWFFEGPGDEDSYTQRLIGIFIHWRAWATLLLAFVTWVALYWPGAPTDERLWGAIVGIVFITIADTLKER